MIAEINKIYKVINSNSEHFGQEVKVTSIFIDSIFAKLAHKRGRQKEIIFDISELEEIPEEWKLNYKEFIKNYIDFDKVDTVDWQKEMSVLSNLVKKYPNKDFWENFPFKFKVKSLLWWKGGGAKDFRKAYNLFTLDTETKKEQNVLLDEKIGKDLKIELKPKNILDII